MLKNTFPAISLGLAPIIITSPLIRSGTTLVQRLLCSDPHAVIFGESVAADFELLLNIYTSRSMMYSHNHKALEITRQKVIDQKMDEWMTSLMPDIPGYVNVLGQICFAGLQYCCDYASTHGYSAWGFKYPGWSSAILALIRQSLPNARLIYIYRDIEACLKSSKSWQPVWSNAEVTNLCQMWVQNLTYALGLAREESILLIRYEDLIHDQERNLKSLTVFTGLDQINSEVLSRRLNSPSTPEGNYITPAELTAKEIDIMQQITAPLRKQLYSLL